jgi:hypothetical protein
MFLYKLITRREKYNEYGNFWSLKNGYSAKHVFLERYELFKRALFTAAFLL